MAENLLIDFGSSPPGRGVRDRLPDATVISMSRPPSEDGMAWEPLNAHLAPPNRDHALSLLERLNALCNQKERRYASIVRYHGFEPWWFHQQLAFDSFLVPYTQYLPLLTRCVGADRVILRRSPEALLRILPLIPQVRQVERYDPDPAVDKALWRGRRAASWLFYRSVSAAALLHALMKPPEALVYSVDGIEVGTRENRWIGGLHRALARRRISFLEVLWSAGGASALRNLRVRRRAVVYAHTASTPERIDGSGTRPDAALHGQDSTDVFLHRLAANILLPAVRRSARGIRRYERLLRRLAPRGVYVMDDCVHAFELVVACKRRRIPTVAVQHGQFGRHTVGLMGYGFSAPENHAFDRYCVWGSFFANSLREHSRLIPPESVVPGGLPRPLVSAHEVPPYRGAANGQARRIVLVLGEQYEAAEQLEQVRPYILALLRDRRLEVRIRPHPVHGAFPIPLDPACAEVVRGSIETAVREVDVVVASYTSAVFEAILHGKPVVLFPTSRYDDPHGLASAGLATRAPSPTHIADAVVQAAEMLSDELADRRDRVWGIGLPDGGEAAIAEMERLQQSGREHIRITG